MAKMKRTKSPAKAAGKSAAARARKVEQQPKAASASMKPEIGLWPIPSDLSKWTQSTKEMFKMNNSNPFSNFNPFSSMQSNMKAPNMDAAMKSMQDMQQMMQSAMDAQMKSANAAQSRWDSMMKTVASKAQNMNERTQQAAKTLMSCKTINELTEAQTKLMQENLEEMMSTAASMSEECTRMMMDAVEPINQQVTASVRKMKETWAA